jgi:hypothetical protein
MTSQWPEVASHVGVIEGMHEDEFFSHRDLAALVASKVRGGFSRDWSFLSRAQLVKKMR